MTRATHLGALYALPRSGAAVAPISTSAQVIPSPLVVVFSTEGY
jgi:hypothetical protein